MNFLPLIHLNYLSILKLVRYNVFNLISMNKYLQAFRNPLLILMVE